MAELSSPDRERKACKDPVFTIWPFIEKLCWPPTQRLITQSWPCCLQQVKVNLPRSVSLALTQAKPHGGGVLAGSFSCFTPEACCGHRGSHPKVECTEHTDHCLGTAPTHASNFYRPGPLCHVYLECSAVLITNSDPQEGKRIQAEAWDSLCEAAGSRPGPEHCRCEPGCHPSRWCWSPPQGGRSACWACRWPARCTGWGPRSSRRCT